MQVFSLLNMNSSRQRVEGRCDFQGEDRSGIASSDSLRGNHDFGIPCLFFVLRDIAEDYRVIHDRGARAENQRDGNLVTLMSP